MTTQFTKDWIKYVYKRAGRLTRTVADAIDAATADFNPLPNRSYKGTEVCALDREVAWFDADDPNTVYYHNAENGPFRLILVQGLVQIDIRTSIDEGLYRAVLDTLFAALKNK